MGRMNTYALPLKSVRYGGSMYKPMSSAGSADSQVVFKIPGDLDWRARNIFQHSHRHFTENTSLTFLLVDEMCPLSSVHAQSDPFRRFPIAGGRLFYAAYSNSIVLTANDILCYFASIPRNLPGTVIECIHVLPLDKVKQNFAILSFYILSLAALTVVMDLPVRHVDLQERQSDTRVYSSTDNGLCQTCKSSCRTPRGSVVRSQTQDCACQVWIE